VALKCLHLPVLDLARRAVLEVVGREFLKERVLALGLTVSRWRVGDKLRGG
jgi:hypothetical protein